MDDEDNAIFCYNNALNNNPSNTTALNQLASIHQAADKYEKARK